MRSQFAHHGNQRDSHERVAHPQRFPNMQGLHTNHNSACCCYHGKTDNPPWPMTFTSTSAILRDLFSSKQVAAEAELALGLSFHLYINDTQTNTCPQSTKTRHPAAKLQSSVVSSDVIEDPIYACQKLVITTQVQLTARAISLVPSRCTPSCVP